MSTPHAIAPQLRPMQESDLDQVIEIEQSVYTHPWSRGIFADCFRVGYSLWVMERDGSLIGYGILSVVCGESHILNLCIRAQDQGQGLGRRLLQHLLNLSLEHHADVTFLEVRPSNRAALALYEAMGFNEVGMRRNYYPAGKQQREDALILALHHTPSDAISV